MADWDVLKTEYIASDISYRKLAEKHNVSFKRVSQIGAKEKWQELRRRSREKAATKIVEKASKERVEKLSGVLKAADGLSDLIARTVERINNLDKEKDKPVDGKIIKELASATKDLTSVIRDLYNLPTDSERVAREIALERLALEKKRMGDEEKNTKVTVVFADGKGHEEWAK